MADNRDRIIGEMERIKRYILPTLGCLVAWFFLNLVMNVSYPAPVKNLWTVLAISPEVWGFLWVLCVMAWIGVSFRPALYLPLMLLFLFFRLFRLGDVLMPMYFNRSFNLYMDSQYIPDLLNLLRDTVSRNVLIFSAVGGIAGGIGITWGIWRSFKTLHRYFSARLQRYLFLGLTIFLVSLWVFSSVSEQRSFQKIFAEPFLPRVGEEMMFIARVKGYKEQGQSLIREVETKTRDFPGGLDKLNGADVYLVFIESYGHTVFANQNYFSTIEPVLQRFGDSLEDQGFSSVSHFMKAATYGGASWLSHAAIASGVRTYDQTQFNLVLNSDIKPLAQYFNEAGYRTISVMPNTTMPWPEGEFFSYQKHYYAWDLEYNGPQYGWSTMPDQFVLDSLLRQELQNRKQPLFIEYVLISSHAPFHQQPPYLEDWSQIDDGSIYHKKQSVTFPIIWPDLTNASEAYMTSIMYVLRTLESYITQFIDDDALIILLGDHQPNVQITGENTLWSVPIHIISRNSEFLKPFKERGYIPGLMPQQPLPHPGMEDFLLSFLEDFSAE